MKTERLVLLAPDRTGHALLVLPVDGVRADLTTLAPLVYASTFGEARADDYAERAINTSLELWAQRTQDEDDELAEMSVEEVLALCARDTDPFPEAEEFFGQDWDGWRPEPQLLTASWLQDGAPEVLRWLGREDAGCGFDYESSRWLGVEDESRVVALLEQRGYRAVKAAELAAAYDDPPREVAGWLAGALTRWASCG